MSRWKNRLLICVATCFGLGYSPIFPGTAGALLGIACYVPIAALVSSEPLQSILLAIALLISCAITFALSPWAERHFQEKDSSKFVTDEVAGFLLTVLLFRIEGHIWLTVLWAFPVTRIIDIFKIPPAKQLEKLKGGWGVLADDLLGSIYAAALLYALRYLLPEAFAT